MGDPLVSLYSLRTDVATALNAAGVKAIDYVAETITPPVVVVVPGDPYLTEPQGTTPFGHYEVSISLLLVAAKGTNKAAATALDSMIEQVVGALDGWDLTAVSQPGQVNLNGSTYLGAVISINQTLKI